MGLGFCKGSGMETECLIFDALATIILCAWIINVGRRTPPHLAREMEDQLKKSADTIRGAVLD